ncbi:MAG: sugar phosphate isomerase/epimerase family protein [Hyphomicrobiaceae bacterium]
MAEDFKDRIGIDMARRVSAEEGIAFAARNGVRYIDIQTDIAPNALESFDDQRCGTVRDACAAANIHLGLHTLSGVNVAEFSPFLRDAADQYLKAYIDLAVKLEAEWIVVHGGYHFTGCRALRKQASVDRLKRIVDYAEKKNVVLQLENLNGEPERAEVHYLPDNLEETIWYFDEIASPHFKWAFTINHAHYDPIGIAGFVDGMGMARCDEVRVADNNGLYELHMHPGTGTVDFVDMFRRIEGAGFQGHYMCGWGTIEQMLEGRDYLADRAREAGVA